MCRMTGNQEAVPEYGVIPGCIVIMPVQLPAPGIAYLEEGGLACFLCRVLFQENQPDGHPLALKAFHGSRGSEPGHRRITDLGH